MTSEIEKLIIAIINSDVVTVRQLATNNPSINKIKSKNNQYPIELAKAKGLKKIEGILILSWDDNRRFYSFSEQKKFIAQLICELSEQYFLTWWEPNIEFEFWKYGNKPEITMPHKYIKIDKIEMKELIMLAERMGYWAYWDDKLNCENVQPITISDWKRYFEK